MLVGIFQVAAGALRLGFLVSFLAHPVISGFTSAAAIIIGLSQLQYFLGFRIDKSQFIHVTLIYVFENLGRTSWQQLLFGLAWWFMLSRLGGIASEPPQSSAPAADQRGDWSHPDGLADRLG